MPCRQPDQGGADERLRRSKEPLGRAGNCGALVIGEGGCIHTNPAKEESCLSGPMNSRELRQSTPVTKPFASCEECECDEPHIEPCRQKSADGCRRRRQQDERQPIGRFPHPRKSSRT